MTTTAIHDRYTNDPVNTSAKITAFEIYHWNRAVSMFKQKLDMPVTSADKDPIWATSALVKGICLAHYNASCPEEAWPLNSAGSSPLDWIRLQDGLHAVWQLICPLEPHSAFNELARQIFSRTSVKVSRTVPLLMAELFELGDGSNVLNNPYHCAVHIISSLMEIECNEDAIFQFFSFSADLDPGIKRLLFMKEPRALLLLAYWYAVVGGAMWHIRRRSIIECQSICIYLERYHSDNATLQQLLEFPKAKCGLLPLETRAINHYHCHCACGGLGRG